jgi:L-ascorbate metabolism protein UlaG (beta-lactamase superfamily)
MIITYHGGECIKASFGDTTLVFNPISKESKLPSARFGADIVLISTNDKDFNGADQMSYGDKQPFVISGPGEYEVQKIFIKGFPSISHYGGAERPNTIYTVILEGMNLCFLGALDDKKVDPKVFEDIESIDVLFVPIGGDGVLSPGDAEAVAVSLEPKIIIPIHYAGIGEKDALKTFLKEAGSNAESIDKLTIKKKDIELKQGEVVVLSS